MDSNTDDGIRAMAAQLHIYQNRDHLNTIQDIIAKWSPKSENDTSSSIAGIAGNSGFKANQNLDLNNSNTLATLISAMTKQENMKSNFTPDAVKLIISNAAGSDLVISTNSVK